MICILISIVITFLLGIIPSINSHAIYMLNELPCASKPLRVGENIMDQNSVADSLGRRIQIFRNTAMLSSGSNYIPGETLEVTVSSFSLGIVIQALGERELHISNGFKSKI